MSTTLPESTLTQAAEATSRSLAEEQQFPDGLSEENSTTSTRSADTGTARQRNDLNEFAYQPMTPLAPITMVIAVCGSIAILGLIGVAIALAGVLTGLLALWQIKRSQGALGGRKLTLCGLVLSMLFFISGSILQVYSFATEVPEGHLKLNFTHDISRKPFVYQDGEFVIAPEVQQYDGKKIFVKGYMYPTKQTTGITHFILVRDSGTCCFGGQPPITDMILVEMDPEYVVNYRVGLVAVAGTFVTKSPAEGGDLKPVYELKGTYCDVSRSIFN